MTRELSGGFVAVEAVRRDGTVPVKLIAPGWGSSGYYPAETLERDGPGVFRSGTKMYWDHPTHSEEAERPEGSLRNLAGVLVSDARWQEAGPAGAGLYADAQVFPQFQDAVSTMAPHIGVSIRAAGRAETGEVEGRRGPVITALTAARSVDFVTEPGAGGRILELFESAREGTTDDGRRTTDVESLGEPPSDNGALSAGNRGLGTGDQAEGVRESSVNEEEEEEVKVDELEKAKAALAEAQGRIGELETEGARLREAILLRDAQAVVREALAGADLPEVTRERLAASAVGNPPTVEGGKLDEAGLRQRVQDAVSAEQSYLQEAAGWQSGKISGMGSQAGGRSAQAVEEDRARMKAAFISMGLSESEAAVAVAGRIQ